MANEIAWDPPKGATDEDLYQRPDGQGPVLKIGTRPDGTRYLWEMNRDGMTSTAYVLQPIARGSRNVTYEACTAHNG